MMKFDHMKGSTSLKIAYIDYTIAIIRYKNIKGAEGD